GMGIKGTGDFRVKTVQKAADIAMQAGSKLYTDSASSYRLIRGYEHDSVNHTKKEYARGEVHENRAECLFSLLKPYLRVFRGLSKTNLPGYLGFFQFLRNFHQLTAFEQAEMILYAALDPAMAGKARQGDFVRCLEHFKMLQSPINLAKGFWSFCLIIGCSSAAGLSFCRPYVSNTSSPSGLSLLCSTFRRIFLLWGPSFFCCSFSFYGR